MAGRIKYLCVILIILIIQICVYGYTYQEFNKIENELTHLLSLTRYDEIIIRTENLLKEKLTDNQKVSIYFYRGSAYLKKGKLDEAIDDLEQVIKLKGIGNYHFQRAVSLLLDLLYKTGDEKRLKKNIDALV